MVSYLSIFDVNKLSADQFEWKFGNVIELCVDAAAAVFRSKPFDSVDKLCDEFHHYLDDLSVEEKVVILKLHPDLAGRMALRGELTRESTGEQQSAGLDAISEEQRNIINSRNERYKSKFGFPFIICARENKVQSIIEGLQNRYTNTREQEIANGINEVKKICRLRILDLVKDE